MYIINTGRQILVYIVNVLVYCVYEKTDFSICYEYVKTLYTNCPLAHLNEKWI